MKPIPFGQYQLLERLAIGGMAEVWLARNQGASGTLRKLVALKRILPNISEDQEFIQMFLEEARIAGQLAHSNIAQIYDLGRVNQTYYIALEYVPGVDVRTLWDRVRQRGGFPLAVACHIVARLCEGLDYAHRRKDSKGKPLGIIHRDVSPQNVLVGFGGDLKIIDFGIAKAANRAVRTQTGILKGKFAYMAPEHARGMAMDHRADIYAIGVVLHELITGERVFRAESDFSLLEKVRKAEVETPRSVRPDTPPELERIVMRALAARPEDRYNWASQMQADLERFLVSSRRGCTPKDLGQFVQDHFPDHHRAELQRQVDADSAPDVDMDPNEISEPLMQAPGDGTSMFDSEAEQHTAEVPGDLEPSDSDEPTSIRPEEDLRAAEEQTPWSPDDPVDSGGFSTARPTRVDDPHPGDVLRSSSRVSVLGSDGARRAGRGGARTETDPAGELPAPPDPAYLAAVAGATLASDEVSDAGAFLSARATQALPPAEPERPAPIRSSARHHSLAMTDPPDATLDGDDLPGAATAAAPRAPSHRMRLDDSGPQSLVPEPSVRAPMEPGRSSAVLPTHAPAGEISTGEVSLPPRDAGASSSSVSVRGSSAAHPVQAAAGTATGLRRQEVSIHSAATSPGLLAPGANSGMAVKLVLAAMLGVTVGMTLMVVLMRTSVLGRGTLVVRTGHATATVTIDERPPAQGDVVVDVVKIGRVKVTMEEPRFKPDIQLVEVRPNRVTELQFTAIPAQGSLRIVTHPPGAQVFLDMEKKPGVTPMTLDDMPPDGIHELLLRHPDTQEERISVETRRGEIYVVQKTLRFTSSRVAIETQPPDAIIMEGRDVKGRKSAMAVKLGGTMVLKMQRPGCEPRTVELTGDGNEVLSQRVELTCELMDAEINMDVPAGGHLTVDRMDTGLTIPIRGYKLPATRHRFEVVSRGRVNAWEEKLIVGPQTLMPP